MSGYVRHLAQRAREASLRVARLDGEARARLIARMADALSARSAAIVLANAQDMERGIAAGLDRSDDHSARGRGEVRRPGKLGRQRGKRKPKHALRRDGAAANHVPLGPLPSRRM